MVNALTESTEEGRGWLRKASGRCRATFDPGISEWGNPLCFKDKELRCKSEREPGELKHLSSLRKRKKLRFPK